MSETDLLLPHDHERTTGLNRNDGNSYDPQLSQRQRSSLRRYRADERAQRRWSYKATKFCSDICCPDKDGKIHSKGSRNRSYPSGISVFQKTIPPSWDMVNIDSETLLLLKPLHEYAMDEFDSAQEAHIGLLRKLWDIKYPQGMFELKSQKWLDFGFQTSTPVTDFRGAGMLGLRNIVHVAENYPETVIMFQDIGLLYAACCLNVTQSLVHHLRIHTTSGYNTKQNLLDPSAFNSMGVAKLDVEPSQKEWVESMRGFARLILNHHKSIPSSNASLETFDDLVGANMYLLIRTWDELERKNKTRKTDPPTIMDFPRVLFSSRCNLMFLLSHQPSTTTQLIMWIDELEEYDLIN